MTGLGAGQSATLILPGLDEDQIRKLHDAGLNTAEELSAATSEQLLEVAGIDEDAAWRLKQAVENQLAAQRRAAAAAAEESEAAEAAEESEAAEAAEESEAAAAAEE